ncbi:MAG: DNA ligase D [Thermoproteota archaeon]|nr:DNA ligase D [Thermoproteota archaeon]
MLEEYNKKRNFVRTPEPRGNKKQYVANKSRFVVQKHDATRLHYDFRLEDEKEGVLKSWAVPKGISLDPKIKRLAVLTEDHPVDYLLFEGIIPEDSYGAGTVIVWDTGTYISEQEISDQFKKGKITFSLFGQKLRGKFKLIRIHSREEKENQWLLMKLADGFESEEDLTINKPESVLTGRTNDDLKIGGDHEDKRARSHARNVEDTIKKQANKTRKTTYVNNNITKVTDQQQKEEFPTKIKPMLSTLVDKPFDNKDWVFEVKWDGVRSILFLHKKKGILEMQSRNGKSITHRYPELVKTLSFSNPSSPSPVIKCRESVVLDGEVVVLDTKNGIPSFQSHQRRMNVDYVKEIENLSKEIPATYYFFDILYLDGINLQGLFFLERRKILSDVIAKENARIKISHFIEEKGKEVFDKTKSMGLEGLVAKHRSSTYKQGIRSRDWLKIKHIKTQDCIVIGYTRGEGNREYYFGSLLLAIYDPNTNKLRFVGHTGSGFDFVQLDEVYSKLKAMSIEKCPVDYVPYTNRDPIWIRPELVAEIKFSDWTEEKIMRAPIFLRFREDKATKDCLIEGERPTEKVLEEPANEGKSKKPKEENLLHKQASSNSTYSSSFSNLDKVYWVTTPTHPQLTKKDLIKYYDSISSYILPYLRDRPLSLSRYPDGIKGKSFYHKNWDQENKPAFVQSAKIYSESREGHLINYIVCNNKETLLWLANLGCIEMHPWYSRINNFNLCQERDDILYEEKCGLNFPDFIIFDLDPYIYSGREGKGQEPEYNHKGFKAAVEVAYILRDLFNDLRIESFIKTSGKTGLHIFVPIDNLYTYEQTRAFAEVVGKILLRRYPEKITMEWDTAKRKGKVFFDHNQNARGKTIASIFSARPTESATVSMPIKWKELSNVYPTDYTILNVPDILNKRTANSWDSILEKKQDLHRILENISQLS